MAEPDSAPGLTVACILRHDSAKASSRHGRDVYDLSKDSSTVCLDVDSLWCVSHMVREVPGEDLITRKPSESDVEFRRRARRHPITATASTGRRRASRSTSRPCRRRQMRRGRRLSRGLS